MWIPGVCEFATIKKSNHIRNGRSLSACVVCNVELSDLECEKNGFFSYAVHNNLCAVFVMLLRTNFSFSILLIFFIILHDLSKKTMRDGVVACKVVILFIIVIIIAK